MDPLGQDSSHIQPNDGYSTPQQFSAVANSFITGAAATAAPAPKNKRKHNTLTLADKYGIILRLDQGEPSAALCREFNIGRSTLYDIKTNRAEIEKFVNSPSYSLHDRKTLKKGDYPEVEEALYSWYTDEKNRIQITGDLLKEKGKYFFSMIHKRDDFQASEGWLDKFKKRFGIRLSATVDNRQPIPAEFVVPALTELPADYVNKFLTIVEQLKLLPEQVFFTFGGIINSANLPTGICQPFALQTQNLAFMPCVNVTGNHKLDLLVVGNNHCSKLPEVANYVVQEHVQISATVLQEWYLEQFIPSVMKYRKKQNLPRNSLLIVANVSSFPDEADMKIKTVDGLIDVMFVPQYSADVFQNMGLDLISSMKMFYKKRLLMDFLSKPFTRIDAVMQKYGVKEAVCNLAYAWERVPPAKLADHWLLVWQDVAYSPEFRSLTANGNFGNGEAEIEAVISLFCSRHIPDSRCTISAEELRLWLTTDFKNEPDDGAWPDNQALPDPNLTAASTVSCDEAASAVNILLQWAGEQGVEDAYVLALKKLQEKVLISSVHYNNLNAK